MIDYKTWVKLNESLGFTLGVATPNKVGGLQGAFQYLDEKKNAEMGCKYCKKMKNECKCDCHKKGGKFGKQMGDLEGMPHDADDLGADMGMDPMMGDMGGQQGDQMGGQMGDMDPMMGDMGMGGQQGDQMGDMGMGGQQGDQMGDQMGDQFGDQGDDMDDEDIEKAEEESGEDLDGDDEEGEPEDHVAKVKGKGKKAPMPLGFMKKKMKKESTEDFLNDLRNEYISPKNQMASEEDFWKSIQGYNYDPKQKFSDGFTELKEDLLITPAEAPAPAPAAPQPGEVGFAPQQRMGVGSDYQLPPLEEGKKPRKSWLS